MARRICSSLTFLAICVLCLLAARQTPATLPATVGAEDILLGRAAAPLYGPWKFKVGDSPIDPVTQKTLWAEPAYDDSNWETVDLTPKPGSIDPTDGWVGYVPGWTGKGHPGHSGYAWYRIRVQMRGAEGSERRALAIWDVDDAYQFFSDGTLLGGFGKFSGPEKAPEAYWSEPEVFLLPERKLGAEVGKESVMCTLAFRVWMAPNTLSQNPDGGGLHIAPMLGGEAAVDASYQNAWLAIIRAQAPPAADAALFLVLTVVACSLMLFDSSDPVYLWLTGVFLLTAANAANSCLAAWTQTENDFVSTLAGDTVLKPLILGGWVMVWWVWFRLNRPRWLPGAIAGLTLLYGIFETLGEDLLFTVVPHPVSAVFHDASIVTRLLMLSALVLIMATSIRQQGREAWLALPAVVLVGIGQFQVELLVLGIPTMWFPFGFGIYLSELANAVLSAVIFALLMRRLLLALRRQRLIALDLKQAQEVQQVMLPEAHTRLPGLLIESEYRPAREVGGDFFQIIPNETDGSLLIVAGDVTGKGLRAGMQVALLVGAIRSTVDWSADPVVVLRALNQRLIGRGDAQATCLALRIEADGGVTLANAGHIQPYLNGEPVPMEGALPLGLIEGAESSVMNFQLSVGDKLVLMSDGIAEATDAEGNLFGFERVHELLRTAKSAAEVASVAQTFGQEDDISVVFLTRTAGPKAALA
jgi:hypothetical protein